MILEQGYKFKSAIKRDGITYGKIHIQKPGYMLYLCGIGCSDDIEIDKKIVEIGQICKNCLREYRKL